MNNIIFSNLTRKQILDAYKAKEYKKTIGLLRNVFITRENFLNYLNDNGKEIDSYSLRKFRDILYIWTVIEEFKAILNNENNPLTVAYMQEYDKDYVKEYFNLDEIDRIKEISARYFDKQKNRLLLKNYLNGNFTYVMGALKCDYIDHADFESKLDTNSKMTYEKSEIAPLRELAHIYRFADFNLKGSNELKYKYAILKNLISIYRHMNIEYTERYLLRQKKIGIDLNYINEKELLSLFTAEERAILLRIYKENIKNGIKVNKGYGLYGNMEYSRSLHIVMTILEMPYPAYEKYKIMKDNYKYPPAIIRTSINSTYVKEGIKETSLKEINKTYEGYKKVYDDMGVKKQFEKDQKLGIELGRIITEFLDNNVDVDSYFNQNNLLKNEYKRILKYVDKYCPDVYKRFMNYRQDRIRMATLLVINAMNNNPDFCEIDYYAITNIPYRVIKDYLKKINSSDYYQFSKFVKENKENTALTDIGLKAALSISHVVRVEDKEGNVYMKTATEKDKKYVVAYLRYINAPITSKNIIIALRRLLNNKLYTEENNLQKRITL